MENPENKMKRVTGIGGVFFKDLKKVTEWYQKHLGLETNPYGATFLNGMRVVIALKKANTVDSFFGND